MILFEREENFDFLVVYGVLVWCWVSKWKEMVLGVFDISDKV